ncbi:hypothetical protein AVEN_211038-1 [Araneus ventricosus]|uniref:Uncharacterized protein n=1 Tax=Araneus ventricosus TaxID=182803 RepID=A0A4Y2SEE3_ARAVE|nr:hypothetical protein AVEN_211038-1 [Araneus ventricosus]
MTTCFRGPDTYPRGDEGGLVVDVVRMQTPALVQELSSWSKGFLRWNLEDERRTRGPETREEEIETRLNSESDSDSNLDSRER